MNTSSGNGIWLTTEITERLLGSTAEGLQCDLDSPDKSQTPLTVTMW